MPIVLGGSYLYLNFPSFEYVRLESAHIFVVEEKIEFFVFKALSLPINFLKMCIHANFHLSETNAIVA